MNDTRRAPMFALQWFHAGKTICAGIFALLSADYKLYLLPVAEGHSSQAQAQAPFHPGYSQVHAGVGVDVDLPDC